MKTTGFIACVIVAIDCAKYALGPQDFFGTNFVWLWWIVALGWAISAIRFVTTVEFD